MRIFGRDRCNHTTESGTGRSTEININLYVKPKGIPDQGYYGPNMQAFSAEAYVICEIVCTKCGEEIERRSVVVKPEDLETKAFYPPEAKL